MCGTKGRTALIFGIVVVSSLFFAIYAGGKSPAPETIVVALSSQGDNIAFDKTTLKIKVNQRIKINFTNLAAPDTEILHDVAILQPGTEASFLQKLSDAGYDVKKLHKDPDLIGVTQILPPGKSGGIVFQATKPGNYPFICTMPGHAEFMGMKGNILVSK